MPGLFFFPQSFPNLTRSSDSYNKILLQKQAALHARADYPGNFEHGCLNGILARRRSLSIVFVIQVRTDAEAVLLSIA